MKEGGAQLAFGLTAAFHTTRLAVPAMKKKGWGRIINTASAHSLAASPFKSAYVAAKHGIVGFTKVTALETAQTGVTANAICPGWIMTGMADAAFAVADDPDTAKADALARHPAGQNRLSHH